MARPSNGKANTLSDEDLSEGFTSIVQKYILKNSSFIMDKWRNIIKTRVYSNDPVCYVRTESLTLGFDAEIFAKSFKILIDDSGFTVDLNYTFDISAKGSTTSPVYFKHCKERGTASLDKFMVNVSYPGKPGEKVNLPTFMRTNRKRAADGGTPLFMSKAWLASALKGSFRPSTDGNASYFAAYFIAGPNAKGNPVVYEHGGANPKGGGTTRDKGKYTIILDFLASIGLKPESRSKPSGESWTIKVAPLQEVGSTKSNPSEVGGLLAALYRAADLIKAGEKVFHEDTWTTVNGTVKSTTRLADVVRSTAAWRRWSAAFYGSEAEADRNTARPISVMQESAVSIDAVMLTPAEEQKVEFTASQIAKMRKDLLSQGYSPAQATAKLLEDPNIRAMAERAQLAQEAKKHVGRLSASDLAEGGDLSSASARQKEKQFEEDRDSSRITKIIGTGGSEVISYKYGLQLQKVIESNPDMGANIKLEYIKPNNPKSPVSDGKWKLTVEKG